jgi:nitroreductase/NAD-dependent dihydropyrimidine dehydrogenase PreA subunit
MDIPTSRTRESGEVRIDASKCNGCGKCVEVCNGFVLVLADRKVKVNEADTYGCYACGHCMAICSEEAIKIHGRTLSPDDVFDLPAAETMADYQQLLSLLQRRRSIREFTERKVEQETIEKILEAAKTSPMGYPPSDVNVLIFDTKEKNRKFAEDFCDFLKEMKWFVSTWFLTLMRPFWGKTNDEIFRKFVRPAFEIYIGEMDKGVNLLNYDAPLAMYFYGSPYIDPADSIVAATTAMYAAESLGLGTCMIGMVHPLLQYGRKAKQFRKKYDIKFKSREGIFVIFGYPKVEYRKGLKRTFASVTSVKDCNEREDASVQRCGLAQRGQ